jgi:hypothetical protein
MSWLAGKEKTVKKFLLLQLDLKMVVICAVMR